MQEVARLLDVRAGREIEHEGFEASEVHPAALHDGVGGEEDAAAVDPAGEADADGFVGRDAIEPLRYLVCERGDVFRADEASVRR